MAGVLGYPVEQVAARLRVPTLILWGERDPALPLRVARRLHATIPDSELITYPESGHCPQLDAPERFNADLLRFIRS